MWAQFRPQQDRSAEQPSGCRVTVPCRAARVICADIQTAATRVVTAWAVAMPVAASQLVLTVAAEDRALVGAAGWAVTLPLAASGVAPPAVFRFNPNAPSGKLLAPLPQTCLITWHCSRGVK